MRTTLACICAYLYVTGAALGVWRFSEITLSDFCVPGDVTKNKLWCSGCSHTDRTLLWGETTRSYAWELCAHCNTCKCGEKVNHPYKVHISSKDTVNTTVNKRRSISLTELFILLTTPCSLARACVWPRVLSGLSRVNQIWSAFPCLLSQNLESYSLHWHDLFDTWNAPEWRRGADRGESRNMRDTDE